MKIGGIAIEGPQEEILVVPHGENEFVFRARNLNDKDYEDFDKLCPKPVAPEVIKKGGERFRDVKDEKYNEAINKWASNRTAFTVIKSLEPSNIEWDDVDLSNPDTWEGYKDELAKCFGENTTALIMNTAFTACGLNQKKIEEATQRFLASRVAPVQDE